MQDDYISVNRQAYDTLHAAYDQRASLKSAFEERVDVLCGAALRHATMAGQRCVLEIGPGSGEALAYFELSGWRTVAIELCPKLACVARRRSPRTAILVGDVKLYDFVEASFQIIYAGAVIHLFPKQDALKLLGMFYRWLAPNGILFVSTTVHEDSEEGFSTKTDYGPVVRRFRRRWTESDFKSSIQSAGFQIAETLHTDEKDRNKRWVAHVCRKSVP